MAEIARMLNAESVRTEFGRAWTREVVRAVLTCEKYIGNNVYHRKSVKLKSKVVTNPPERWVRADGAFQGIVNPELFFQAREIIRRRAQKLTDEQLLEKLDVLASRHHRVTGTIIDNTPEMPSAYVYKHRFGSLNAAYRRIGYVRRSWDGLKCRLYIAYNDTITLVTQKVHSLGAVGRWESTTELLHINDELRLFIAVCKHRWETASSRWVVRMNAGAKPDITVVIRMNATNDGVRDYYLFPFLDGARDRLRLAENNGAHLDCYRFATLDYLWTLIERIEVTAAIGQKPKTTTTTCDAEFTQATAANGREAEKNDPQNRNQRQMEAV